MLQHVAFFFFFNDTATTEIYTLSLHDALPISGDCNGCHTTAPTFTTNQTGSSAKPPNHIRSEEHTSELQSLRHLVCRLLLEKKKKTKEKMNQTQTRRLASVVVASYTV